MPSDLSQLILQLRSRLFSVDALVHAERFLGLDGEGSITAPAAVRDSSSGRLNRRCGQTSNVCSGSNSEVTMLSRHVRSTPQEQTSSYRPGHVRKVPNSEVTGYRFAFSTRYAAERSFPTVSGRPNCSQTSRSAAAPDQGTDALPARLERASRRYPLWRR